MAEQPRVLVVDDDTEIIDLLQSTLAASGCHTIIAFNGRDALMKAEKEVPDLILLDIGLPGMDGFDVCRKFRSREITEFVPIIMMTGDVGTKNLVKSFETGADEFITKPFNILEFNARISVILRKKSFQDKIMGMNRELQENACEHNRKLQNLYLETVKSLITAIDAKDHYTYKHSKNVAKFAKFIAKHMGFSQEEISNIEQSAQLHDLGKIAVSDTILNKKEKLTNEDWNEIKKHPVKSAEILEPLECMIGKIEMVKQHHERIDGMGYPDSLKGTRISIGAKILAVADSYDAMTRERPYRKAFTKQEAIREMEENNGTQFEPEILKVLFHFLKKNT